MKLYFLRHGQAGDRETWQGDDTQRPLTKEGKDLTRRAGAMMKALHLAPVAIVTSPLVRARQTAQVAAEEMGLSARVVEDRRLEPGFGLEELKSLLESYTNADALMLVGHEPDFSSTISRLIGGGEITVKKGALALVDVPDVEKLEGDLLWLIPPKLLALRTKG